MKSTICLCMMVKNEAHVISNALRSVKPFIDHWVIVDTGSTDNTKDIIANELAGIQGELLDIPFKNYGYNRTEVFKAAYDKADYMLVLDADDIFHMNKPLPQLTSDCYEVDLSLGVGGLCVYRQLRLFSTRLKWEYRGAVHEVPFAPGQWKAKYINNILIESFGTGATSHDPEKYLNHARMIKEDIDTNPDCDIPRSTFYLAQSLFCAGKNKEAIPYYRSRTQMVGGTNPNEIYYSYYQLGNIAYSLKAVDHAIANFLYAHNADPRRAEPLYKLCLIYRNENKFTLGYLFGSMAVACKPDNSFMFCEPHLYGVVLWDEMALCAFYTGRKKLAATFNRKILAVPNLDPTYRKRIEENLAWAVK